MPEDHDVVAPDERARVEALHHYQILDTPPDGAFDRVTRLVADLLHVPISIISLVDTDRIWFKSSHGVDATEVGRAPGLCASAILRNEPYVIENAAVDPRSLSNPLVAGELGLRFYAGVPLRTKDGHNLGVLTAIDVAPRTLSERELRVLQDLAQMVMDQMDLRLAARRIAELHEDLECTHEALKVSASRDALTGALNRSAILEHVDRTRAVSLREGEPLTLMIVDVDHFKDVNDRLGHVAGDDVLVEVARRLKGFVRGSDALGRLGGDEFLVAMYPCDERRARDTAQRICDVVSGSPMPCPDVKGECIVTLSVGIHTRVATEATTVRHLLQRTDAALYAAKRGGRDRTSSGEGDAAPIQAPASRERTAEA